jgi:signal transduction histidine kinase
MLEVYLGLLRIISTIDKRIFPVTVKGKILIVDDSVDTVELLKKRLAFEGYSTLLAYNGTQGLEQATKHNPDLIILDIMMPGMDGYEVCEKLKASRSTRYIPILMLTAKSGLEHKIKGLGVGANDYLAKPFDYKELSARIKSLLSIKSAREELVSEEKSEALDQMMDELAHELRNPLTSIGGLARRVHENLPKKDRNREYLEMMIQEVARLEYMVNELVELKTTALSFKEQAEINDIIMDALGDFEKNCEKNEIKVETELLEHATVISADKKQMKLAMESLIKNAIEAMDCSSEKLLKIKSYVENGRVKIEMYDTGRGIPKEKIKNVFDPFFTSKTSGPGLGLTLALRIIQEHRGNISIESEPQKGTCVTISLPVKRM